MDGWMDGLTELLCHIFLLCVIFFLISLVWLFVSVFIIIIVAEFCATELGSEFCRSGNVRNFFVQEEEALGPAVAR